MKITKKSVSIQNYYKEKKKKTETRVTSFDKLKVYQIPEKNAVPKQN